MAPDPYLVIYVSCCNKIPKGVGHAVACIDPNVVHSESYASYTGHKVVCYQTGGKRCAACLAVGRRKRKTFTRKRLRRFFILISLRCADTDHKIFLAYTQLKYVKVSQPIVNLFLLCHLLLTNYRKTSSRGAYGHDPFFNWFWRLSTWFHKIRQCNEIIYNTYK